MPTNDKVFLDSNFIVYLYDLRYPKKRERAEKLLQSIPPDLIVISTQVLKEVCSVLIKKVGYPIADLKIAISFFEKFEIADTPAPVIRHALDLMLSYSISFWDALIITTAQSAYCKRIYTEDLQHGQKFNGLEIVNPFKGDSAPIPPLLILKFQSCSKPFYSLPLSALPVTIFMSR